MVSEKRNRKMKLIKRQIEHCRVCLETIAEELENGVAEQDADPFYKWERIRNHTRYANDVIYLRRQLMKLEKMLTEG